MLSAKDATSRRITTYVICEAHYHRAVDYSVIDHDRDFL